MNVRPNNGSSQPRFFWRGVLILLPLALLAGVGIWSLFQDRLMAEAEARNRCQQAASQYAQVMEGQIWWQTNLPLSRITLDEHGELQAIDNSRSKTIFPERRGVTPPPLERLTTSQRELWERAVSAEILYRTNVAESFSTFIASSPPQAFLTRARYSIALSVLHSDLRKATNLLWEVRSDPSTTTEGGVPYSDLAMYQLTKLNLFMDKSKRGVWQTLLDKPTLLSRPLLEELAGPHSEVIAHWERDQSAREFYAFIAPRLSGKDRGAQCGWVPWRGEDWLWMRTSFEGGSSVGAVPASFVERAVARAIPAEQRLLLYAQPVIRICGKAFPSAAPSGQLLATGNASLADNSDGKVEVTEFLAHPEILYAEARRRTWWFAALIAVSAAAAVAGLASAWRGFRQQCQLNELKSNFVSSVSHELRAPIASMRLMAESLERGKIADPARQREYFGMLVQESRRLAMLIENILDFSRIERGSKSYEFEPANLNALARDTVKMMSPAAAEKNVVLELQASSAKNADSVSCDALAVRQALINLIDNAIKHSPSGGRVLVGVENGGTTLSLWVEDKGAGIPREEHQKIFERFYRRGSELRRETQGIGIGLTIVKHIVDGHRGRVAVRSAPGEGSRFTIELPLHEN